MVAAACALTLVVTVAGVVDPQPPAYDIVDFELAGSVGQAQRILDAWEAQDAIGTAKAIQLLDLGYPLVYSLALAGLCLAAAGAWQRAGRPRAARAGSAMAWMALAAAGFDYVENLGLAITLWGEPASPWPQVAYVAAVAKFAGIAAALLYALSGLAPAYAPRYRA